MRKVSAPLDEVGPGSIPFTKLKVLFLSYHFTGEMGLFFKPLTLSESKIHTHSYIHTNPNQRRCAKGDMKETYSLISQDEQHKSSLTVQKGDTLYR